MLTFKRVMRSMVSTQYEQEVLRFENENSNTIDLILRHICILYNINILLSSIN